MLFLLYLFSFGCLGLGFGFLFVEVLFVCFDYFKINVHF